LSEATRTFGGRYEVIERVGSGGMAEVFRARDDLLGREVAVKVLSERFARDRSFVERFRREAQSAANLNHPNIVSLYDYGADNGTYFIVMEFIDGRPLDDIIRTEGALLPERAAEIASDIAQALHKAHLGGLVHRDVKPSNVMMTSQGQTKVTDFGIARALVNDGEQTVTQTGMVIGTASYLSPEQAQGNPVDARSDVYSLGCVLYEMLTGSAPFAGDTPLSIAYKHVREDPQAPSRRNRDVPRALDAIVMKALAKNPDNRYSSALEMKQDLDRYSAGQQVQATPLLAGETTAVHRRADTGIMREDDYEEPARRRVWPWLAALAALALLVGVAWALLAGRPPARQVDVPNVVGLTYSRAVDVLQENDLDNRLQERPNEAPVGEVFRQDPVAQESVDEGTAVTLFVSTGPRETSVPDLTGRTLAEAEELLREAKLERGDVAREFSDVFDKGVVMDQDPPADERIPVNSEVSVTVSRGPERADVPFVVGLPEEQAVQSIQGAGFDVEIRREPDAEVEEGIVASQDPAGGTPATAGDTVVILVSTGAEEIPLPDVTGQDADDAEAMLEELGLEVSQAEETGECVQPPGTVCDTDPEPGTPVQEGDEVTIFILGGNED
jgi:eukaryotic-like serine/threonine-protein kinase